MERYKKGGEARVWRRVNTLKALRKVAIPVGRLTSRGRPILWQPVPELLALRSPIGRRRA
jgi:hypothetical protein